MLKSLTIVLSGQAGQGLATIETLVGKAVKKDYLFFSTKEVMSRVRGGNNTVEIRIASEQVYAYKHTIDLLFLLNDHAFYRLDDRIDGNTLIFGEPSFIDDNVVEKTGSTFIPLDLTELASSAGSVLYSNTVLFGFISGLLGLDTDVCHGLIEERFKNKNEKIISGNLDAFNNGFDLGKSRNYEHGIRKTETASDSKTISGTEAIGIGAIGGGVNFVAAYPMSPSTGVLQFLAEKGEAFDIIVEQAEDEIAAINMVVGAWYAGARGLVTTSGGGLALMEEGISLSGITETPCVVHIAQRPGPGTGLPTRTEQADLNLAIYAGHGEFPRIVLAPGSLEDGVLLTQKAFYLADKYQVPVIILSDQFYVDSKSTIRPLVLSGEALESFVVKSDKAYLRYKHTDSGISPRAVPGNGDGLVKCDSDEHDERGGITEDFKVRIAMNNKRLGKEQSIMEDYIPPELIGPADFKKLVVGWGSTYGVLKEAVEGSQVSNLAFLHIKEVHPLSQDLVRYLDQAESIAVFENNASGQLSNHIARQLGRRIEHRILKYDGTPFSIEEVDNRLKEVFQNETL